MQFCSAVLPPFQRVIFDEAHKMESAATSFFSESLNKFMVFSVLSRLHSARRGRVSGVLVRLESISANKTGFASIPSLIEDVRDRIQNLDQNALSFTGESSYYRLEGSSGGEIHSGKFRPVNSCCSFKAH